MAWALNVTSASLRGHFAPHAYIEGNQVQVRVMQPKLTTFCRPSLWSDSFAKVQ
jgi:hypothetical protein